MNLETLVALGRLPSRERELLVDYALVGVSQNALARREGLSDDAVQSIIRRAGRSLLASCPEIGEAA